MNRIDAQRLLAADEPPPFSVEREHGRSPFVLICDHAGRRIPRRLGTLGVAESELQRHIAWDIGARGEPTLLISMHSFTPVFHEVPRPWHVGMLYNRDVRLAHVLLDLIRAEGEWTVGDNEPYSVSDGTDYAIPVHGEQRGLPHIEIEVRQDLITDEAGQREWAERIAGWLVRAREIGDFG
jgi:predicted N-formylglutamate amidohydrolase